MANKVFGYIAGVALNLPSSGGVASFDGIAIDSSGNNILPFGSTGIGVTVPFSYSDTPLTIWEAIVAAFRLDLGDPTIEVVCMPGTFDQLVETRSY